MAVRDESFFYLCEAVIDTKDPFTEKLNRRFEEGWRLDNEGVKLMDAKQGIYYALLWQQSADDFLCPASRSSDEGERIIGRKAE